MQIHFIILGWLPAIHSMAWGNMWQQKKKPCQLPWLHSTAIMQPSVLCTAFSAALLKPSTTASYNKEQLTRKEPSLLQWCVASVDDNLQFVWWATAGGAVWLKQLPTSTQHPAPLWISALPSLCAGGEHMGHTPAFMIQHQITYLCPLTPVILGKLRSPCLAMHFLCAK